ncbi:uncharacterized protein J3D65DRAFT_317759 [Phyllosticta citribraziliensis]|uniref:Uncharacterized protein n=1 Tax=Phyllosticta citribraziliensis TaxID=989973 RepID=A0ABR1LSK8_9PEZI
MSVASQVAASRDGHVVRLRQGSPSPSPSKTTGFQYLPPGSRDFQRMLATFHDDSIADLLPSETISTNPEDNQCDPQQPRRSASPPAATEPSLVTFEPQDAAIERMLPARKPIKTYSRKNKIALISSKSRQESRSSDDGAGEASDQDRERPKLKRKRPVKPAKRRLPTTRQLALVPSSIFQETDTDSDADDDHLTPPNDPIEDAHDKPTEQASGDCGAAGVVARRMTLTSLEKQFRPARPTELTAYLSAFKFPKIKSKSTNRPGDGFSPSELSLPAKKRPRRNRRLNFQGSGTLKIIAGELPAPYPLEVNRAHQLRDPAMNLPRQILGTASDRSTNAPKASQRVQPTATSPAPSQHLNGLNALTGGSVAAHLLQRTQCEMNDRIESNPQRDEMIPTRSLSRPESEAVPEYREETYEEIMGIVVEEDEEFSDMENVRPESAANKSDGANEDGQFDTLAQSDAQQEPEDVLFHLLDPSRPGQKARMKSSGLWMEVYEDIEGVPDAAHSHRVDNAQRLSHPGADIQKSQSATMERPVHVDPLELDFRTSSRALKGSIFFLNKHHSHFAYKSQKVFWRPFALLIE